MIQAMISGDDDEAGMTQSTAGPAPTSGVEPTGPRRALIAIYGTFALAATARAGVQLATRFHEAPLAYVLSLLSGLIYIGATVGLTTRRGFGRPLAWASCGAELVGVLTIGTLSLADKAAFPDDTVWSDYGSGYVYIPVVLPILGLAWLYFTRHMRHPAHVEKAGGRAENAARKS
jgi:hypothetical protein